MVPIYRSGLIVASVLTCGLVAPSLGRFVASAVCAFCSLFARDDVFQFQNLFSGLAIGSFLVAAPFFGWFLGHRIADRWFGPVVLSEMRPIRIVAVRARLIKEPVVMTLTSTWTKYFAVPGDLYLMANCFLDTAHFRKCRLINPRYVKETLEFDFVALPRKTWLPRVFRMGSVELLLTGFQRQHPEIKAIRVFDGCGGNITATITG